MSFLDVLALVVVLVFVAVVGGVVTIGVYAGRRAVRAGRVASRQLGRAHATARAAIPGPTRAVHAERARIAREVSATVAAYEAGRRSGRPVAGFASHAQALAAIGRRLDVDLAVIAAEPSALTRASWLTEVRPRVDTLTTACSRLRRGILIAGDTHADAALEFAARELDEQVEYLLARSGAYRDLTAR